MRLHRDTGYLACGLTIVYALSGIAVNHRGDWDYNRSTERVSHQVGVPAKLVHGLSAARRGVLERHPAALEDTEVAALIDGLRRAIGGAEAPRNVIWRSRDRVVLYWGAGDEHTLEYDVHQGVAVETRKRERPFWRDVNFLHLNEARGAYTLVADGYAAALLFLALSGAFIARGSRGLRGRGGVLLALGVSLPLACLIWYRWF